MDATLDGETVGLRCEDGRDRRGWARRNGGRRRRGDRRHGDGARPRTGERAHARGDDALPGLRGRPAADGVARGAHLARGGPARARACLLGDAPGVRRDDPHRHGRVLGHVLAPRGGRAGGRGRGPSRRCRRAADRRWRSGRRAREGGGGAGPRARVSLGAGERGLRAARAIHGWPGLASLGWPSGRRSEA